jgi:hypothetical protein
MTKWTKIEDYRLDVVPFDDFDDLDTVTGADIASQNCVFPDCATDDGSCAFGCPFKSNKGLK